MKIGATVFFTLLALTLPGAAMADTCRCLAHFEVRVSTSFKPDVPVDHFTALNDRGPAQTNNACRREARNQAHACMDNIWRNRWSPSNRPSQCHTTHGIRGSVPYDIKDYVERAACQTGSPIAGKHKAVVKVYRRTHGGQGCGPNLETVQSVFVSDYTVDCLSIRSRKRLGMVGESRLSGIDRPGSDLSGSGVTVGNGSVGACQAACDLRSGCKAWTWVPPGVQGNQSKCWLKGSVPWHQSAASSIVSGTRQHNSQ